MTKILVVLSVLALLQTAVAVEKSLIQEKVPDKVAKNEVLEFHPIAGHHFNVKAPQQCGADKAFDLDLHHLKCQMKTPGEQQLSLKICDDPESFCRAEEFKIKVEGVLEGTAVPAKPATAEGLTVPGFIHNDLPAAQEEARKAHKLILIDFSAIWCPPCNRVVQEVFPTPTFQKASADFVRVSLDVDDFSSEKWKSEFHILGVPTLIVTTADLDEIGRRHEGSATVISQWLKDQEKVKKTPLVQLQSKPLKKLKPAERIRLAEAFIEQGKFKDAVQAIEGLTGARAEYLQASARIHLNELDTEMKPEAKAAYLKEQIQKFSGAKGLPAEPDVFDWLADLKRLDAKAAQEILSHLDSVVANLAKSPRMDEEGVTMVDVLSTAGELMEQNNQAEAAKKYFSQAANEAQKLIGTSSVAETRGLHQEQAKCLVRAGRIEEAEKIYASLIQSYPKEYTFYSNYARALFKQKKYPQALEQVSKAESFAYGGNLLATVELKGQILLALGRKREAHELVQKTLSRVSLPDDPESWTQVEYQGLKSLLQETEVK